MTWGRDVCVGTTMEAWQSSKQCCYITSRITCAISVRRWWWSMILNGLENVHLLVWSESLHHDFLSWTERERERARFVSEHSAELSPPALSFSMRECLLGPQVWRCYDSSTYFGSGLLNVQILRLQETLSKFGRTQDGSAPQVWSSSSEKSSFCVKELSQSMFFVL